MLRQILLLAIFILGSCGNDEKPNKPSDVNGQNNTVSNKENKVDNALRFINDYVSNSNKMNRAIPIEDWVVSNSLVTKRFKAELKKIVDEAYKQDSMLGADPILDAQDNPDKGFELESFDEKTGYLTVKGIDWPEIKLTMKIVEEDARWLVDGCGKVNMPNNKKEKKIEKFHWC